MKLNRVVKIGIWSLIILILLIIGFVYYRFEDIVAIIEKEIETKTNIEIQYQEASLGIFDRFPMTRISLCGIEIKDAHTQIPLLYSDRVKVDVNPLKILLDRNTIDIIHLGLDAPEVQYVADKSGRSNWDNLFVESDTPNPNDEFTLFIRSLNIDNGIALYKDQSSNSQYDLKNIEYSGSFKSLGDSLFHQGTMNGKLSVDQNSLFRLDDYSIGVDSKLRGNTSSNQYHLWDSRLSINDLIMVLTGAIEIKSGKLDYNFDVESLEQNLANLLTTISDILKKKKEDLRAEGKFNVKGHIAGSSGNNKSFPTYDLRVEVPNGNVQLPSYTQNETAIIIRALIQNNDPSKSFSHVDISDLRIVQGNNRTEGNLLIDNTTLEPKVEFELRSNISSIATLNDLVNLDLQSGTINLTCKGDFDYSDIQNRRFGSTKFELDGLLSNIKVVLDSSNISVDKSTLSGDYQKLLAEFENATFENSDLSGKIELSQPLNILNENPELNIEADIRSNKIDFNEFIGSDQNEDRKSPSLPNLNGNVNLICKELFYQGYPISDLDFKGSLKKDRLVIENITTKIGNSDVQANGVLNNIKGYLEGSEVLSGTLDLRSKVIDLAELERYAYNPRFLHDDTIDSELFKDFDIRIISSSDLLTYQKTKLNSSLASIQLIGNQVNINEIRSESFGGELIMEGKFVLDDQNNTLDLNVDFQNINISQTLASLPFFRKLSYPLQYIEGKINTTLSLQSLLDSEYNLILPEVDAFGLLETLDGNLIGFEPINKLNEFLKLDKQKDYVVKRSKNWVTIEDGWVQVDPFSFNIDDSKIKVNGAHSLKNELNYTIEAEVPSKLLTKLELKDKVGSEIYSKLNQYRNTKEGYVGLIFSMKGTFEHPILKLNEIDLISAGKEVIKETVQTAKDSILNTLDSLESEIKGRVQDTLNAIEQKVEQKGEEILDSIKIKVKKEVQEKLDSTIGSKLDSIGEEILEGSGIQDSLKQQINKLKDLFRKKKIE